MVRFPASVFSVAFLWAGLAGGMVLAAETAPAEEKIPPYKLVRTLENIQDTVIRGDLNAADMQRFLIQEIDRRLRSVDQSVFDDPRNVDAALIYAMSGGNPATLDVLAQRDVAGNFDNRVTSVLRRYLSGKGSTAIKQLKELVPEYRGTAIGPYLELIGANAVMANEPALALKFFDWARIEKPGTIVEEAALRRSLNIAAKNSDAAKALSYARRYARRFMTSPYASQFADIFVSLAIDHPKILPPAEIKEVLSLVEPRRQREIYLRLARRAAINGDRPLADFSSSEARHLSKPADTSQIALADLYSGLVNIPGEGIEDVLKRLATISDKDLTPKDRFLRDAAQIVAEEVLDPPGAESLTQVKADMVDKEYRDRMSEMVIDAQKTTSIAKTPVVAPAETTTEPAPTRKQALDAEISTVEDFVSTSRARLKDIDALLSSEGN